MNGHKNKKLETHFYNLLIFKIIQLLDLLKINKIIIKTRNKQPVISKLKIKCS
jgi:hypothetical protein